MSRILDPDRAANDGRREKPDWSHDVTCVCGLGASNETCCLPLIRGEQMPATAEELMRSRYAAYVLGEVDYIVESTDPDHREGVDRDSTAVWAKESQWLGFELLGKEGGEAGDEEGSVEFVARYKLRGLTVAHREHSTFRKRDGRWYFVDGKQLPPPPAKNEALV